MAFSNPQPNWHQPRFDWNKLRTPQQPKCIKIFPADQNASVPVEPSSQGEVEGASQLRSVSLSELLQPLAEAMSQSQVWLEDFANEKVILSSDLYDVVTMFGRLQNPPNKNNPSDPGDST